MNRERFLIYPWDVSSTNTWTPEGLRGLRDETVEMIAEMLTPEEGEEPEAYVSAVAEYLSHGYERKAAEVTRAVVEIDPSIIKLIGAKFPKQLVNKLLRVNLDLLLKTPSEYPSHLVEYIQ